MTFSFFSLFLLYGLVDITAPAHALAQESRITLFCFQCSLHTCKTPKPSIANTIHRLNRLPTAKFTHTRPFAEILENSCLPTVVQRPHLIGPLSLEIPPHVTPRKKVATITSSPSQPWKPRPPSSVCSSPSITLVSNIRSFRAARARRQRRIAAQGSPPPKLTSGPFANLQPCCVCKDEKSKRDECMLFSTANDPSSDCKSFVEQYKSCMAGFGYKV